MCVLFEFELLSPGSREWRERERETGDVNEGRETQRESRLFNPPVHLHARISLIL